jgi:hypothetical protein
MASKKDLEIEKFILEIREVFPDVAARIDGWLNHLGFEPEDKMYTSMFEALSQATADTIKIRDKDTALKHLKYMSQKLTNATNAEREYIDVYYVEPLLWDIKDSELRKWGWSLIPENLRELYVGVWGAQR